ncbi:NAD(P)-dependent alcohol dehydrogenase [uncultured Sphingomonas sp.]|uniref:zinc-dependent alcohol dehydrogenase family protein n=1 Tax=uncultured Sphingomonas sp. TaxID=158754 RepID=UPI0035CAF6AF
MEERPAATPGRGEVLLRVHATSVNYHDYVGINGGIPNLPVPRVPFSDAVATIEAAGEDVTVALGARVIPSFFPHWQSGPPTKAGQAMILGDRMDGTLQSRVVVPALSLVPAPANLSNEEAATLGCAGLTAWRSVVVEAGVRPGQTVVMQGTGGVSLFALGFAKMLGARVIITSSSDEKLERARALGADVLINYRRDPEWAAAVLATTDGLGADLVVEVGGGATLAQAVRSTKVGGHVSVIGVLTGLRSPDFPLNIVMSRNITMRGITVGNTSDLAAMCQAIELHGYRPVVDRAFDLEDAHEAVATLSAQGHFGKLAIRVDP